LAVERLSGGSGKAFGKEALPDRLARRIYDSCVTSPPVQVEVVCPPCQTRFRRSYRLSINLTLGEEWTEEEIDKATTIPCPGCGVRIDPGSLIVETA
jgi:DNA-directed RNA polymerase subunit RPC12/RpoP